MCCKLLAGNTGREKSPSRHDRTTLSGCVFATKARIDDQKKKLCQQQLAATLRWFTAGGAIRIALQQLLQNRKWRHWWRHNLGSRWKLQKMTRENFSIGAFYNITKDQDNLIKTVGRDSFLSPTTPKNTSILGVTKPPGVAQPLYFRGHN